jgi:chromosome segregation ATPase
MANGYSVDFAPMKRLPADLEFLRGKLGPDGAANVGRWREEARRVAEKAEKATEPTPELAQDVDYVLEAVRVVRRTYSQHLRSLEAQGQRLLREGGSDSPEYGQVAAEVGPYRALDAELEVLQVRLEVAKAEIGARFVTDRLAELEPQLPDLEAKLRAAQEALENSPERRYERALAAHKPVAFEVESLRRNREELTSRIANGRDFLDATDTTNERRR